MTRKVGEGIAVGDDVKIVVMQIKGKQVRLRINASPTTAVHREEVYRRIIEENKKASEVSSDAISEIGITLEKPKGFDSPIRLKRRIIRNNV